MHVAIGQGSLHKKVFGTGWLRLVTVVVVIAASVLALSPERALAVQPERARAGALAMPSVRAAATVPGHAVRPGAAIAPKRAGAAVGDAALTWLPPVVADRTTPYATPNFLESVSCVKGPLCVGVDDEGDVITSAHPTGGAPAWTVTSVGTAPLFAVSCASASLCAAGAELNAQNQGSVAVSTDPAGGTTAWQVDTIPGLQNVAGMSCPTTSLCVGVDTNNQVVVSTDPAGGASAWKLFTVPQVTAGYGMVAVSCQAATFCVAVDGAGNIYVSTDPAGGASAWRHTATLGGPTGNVFLDYRSLSCASVKLCVVDGPGPAQGTASLFATTKPSGGDAAWHESVGDITEGPVTCAPGPVCVLAGYVGQDPGFAVSAAPTKPLSEWGTQTGGEVQYGPANAVSCTGRSLCVAVDSGGNAITATKPVGGFWTTAEVDGDTPLTGISCPTSLLCVAVGDTGVLVTNTEPYDASSAWTPADVDGTEDLSGISCPSLTLCVAVDDQGDVLTSKNPVGGASAWTATPVTGQPLTAVTCTAAPLCVATDGDGDVFTSKNPIGGASAWKRTAVTGSGGGGDVPPPFTAISCTSAPLCVAVDGDGDVITSTDPAGGAKAWTVSYLGFSSSLTSVSCMTSGTCVATYSSGQVATSSDPAGGPSAWTVAVPVSGTLAGLYGVKCADAGLCVAVGGSEIDSTQPGGSWTQNQIDSSQETMTAVDCAGTALCAAVDAAGRVIVGTPPNAYFNWAGYIAQKTGVKFTDVKGTWVQPAVTCPSSTNSTSSFWVGIDAVSTVEQAGTEADCDGKNQPYYSAWYDLAPAGLTPVDVAIHPGDRIYAEVKVTGGKFVFILRNETTGKHYTTKPIAYPIAKRATAEWIAEAPDWAEGVPLADFGTVNFTGSYATGDGHTGAISDPAWTNQAITMDTGDSSGSAAVPTGLSANGTAFSVTWH